MTKKINKPAEPALPNGYPTPPPSLDPTEKEIWAKAIGSFPQDFFYESDLPLLAEYCRAVHTAEMLSGRIADCHSAEDLKDFLVFRDREARRAASLARTLRMPPQSRYDRQAAATAARNTGGRSWQPNPFDEF